MQERSLQYTQAPEDALQKMNRPKEISSVCVCVVTSHVPPIPFPHSVAGGTAGSAPYLTLGMVLRGDVVVVL